MELAKEKSDNVKNSMNLLMEQWKDFGGFLSSNGEPKGVSVGDCVRENQTASRMREIEVREKEIALKTEEFEVWKLEREKRLKSKQNILDERRVEIHLKEVSLSKQETEMCSELEEIRKGESELQLGEKRLKDLEETLDVKNMMLDMKKGSSGAESVQEQDRALPNACAEKLNKNRTTFKLDSSGMEIGQCSRIRPPVLSFSHMPNEHFHGSGSLRNVGSNINDGEDGITFSLTMSQSHSYLNSMKVPISFLSAFDMSEKKHVILLSNKGSFRLGVKPYDREVQFRHGWRDFYRLNSLSIGMKCLFRLKENCVNGDASVFSMDVSILDD